MKPVRFMLSATSLAMLGLFSGGALAHAEHDKPRYVSPSGVDKGACDTYDNPCLTFQYVAQQSNKGDQILVASGQYVINDADSLFYLLSEVVPFKAGFSTVDGFKVRDEQNNTTFLTGVPLKYAAKLRAKGFDVNTDQKALSGEASARLADKIAKFEILNKSQSNVACVNGQASGFACNNIDLLSHVPLSDFGINSNGASDIWGYIDLNTNKEYALIALRNGVSLVDVSNPSEPVVVGTISASATNWRDIKVHQYYDAQALRYKAYAYMTADNTSVGLSIIDLNDLANGISIADIDRTDTKGHNVFLSNVDYSTGVTLTGMDPFLHVAGSNNRNGAFNTFSLSEGSTAVEKLYHPSIVSSYTHDVSAMVIDDDRINSQCAPVNGSCQIFFDYNEDQVKIWDKTQNSAPNIISTFSYQRAAYVHSGWTTEDKQVVIVHDELDERSFNLNTTVRFFDISDMRSPQQISTWTGPTTAIDHNGFVRGNRYYMSNYERGLTVLDISNPASPVEVGNFDTFPLSDNANFNGAWGVYPYLPSGNILISDINSGLYVLADKTVGVQAQPSVKLDASSYYVEEGDMVTVNVSRSGDATSAVTVQYETHVGSANTEDFAMVQGTLEWAAGDTTDKQISVAANTDVLDQEYGENFFVRLFNPTNGLSLTSPNISMVNINGLALPTYASFSTESIVAKETDGTILIGVDRGGDFNSELTVEYDVAAGVASMGGDYEFTAGTLVWAAGESETKHIELTLINDDLSEANEDIVLNLTQPQSDGLQQITVTVRDDESNEAATIVTTDDMSVNTGGTINLAATATDPEGYPLTYQWSQSAGATVNIANSTSSSISVVAPSAADTLVFDVTVTDDFGVTSSASVSVSVTASATPNPTPTPTTSSGGGGGALWFFPLVGLLMGWRRRMR